VDLASLALFRVVAQEQSVTRAAELLGRVPSGVTTRIQQLEADIGARLFERSQKRMVLTEQGQAYLDYAERILNLADEARQVIHATHPSGTLRIGSMESTAASRLPLPLARFNAAWPQVRIDLSTGPTARLLDHLRARRIDMALIAVGPETDSDGLNLLPLYREDLLLLLPSGHPPVAGPADIAPRALAAFAPGCTYRALAENWLTEGGTMAHRLTIHEVGSYHAMFACTAAGACVSIMPRSVVDLMAPTASTRSMPLMSIDTCLAWREGFATPAFRALRDILAEDATMAGGDHAAG